MGILKASGIVAMAKLSGTPSLDALRECEIAAASFIFDMSGDAELAKAYPAHFQKFHDLLLAPSSSQTCSRAPNP